MARWPLRRATRIYLHIGAPSTGTTYLQRLMIANKERLAESGVLFPGARWEDVVRAVRDVMGTAEHDPRLRAEAQGKWAELSGEMLSYDGRAVVLSMEFLCFAEPDVAARVVESLADAEVHVVLTVRDTSSVIRSQWQTSCRNGSKVPLQRLLWGLRTTLNSEEPPDNRPVRMVTRALGIPRMLETWTPLVGPKRMHVITVPRGSDDPDLLWKRFASVVGVKPGVATEKAVHSNTSLGLPSSELLRMVNIALGDIHRIEYRRVVKTALARDILGELAVNEPKVALNRPGRNMSARWNERVRDAITASGSHLVGSLDDLPTERAPEDMPTELAKPTDEEVLTAAAFATERMAEIVAGLEEKVTAVREGRDDGIDEDEDDDREGDPGDQEPREGTDGDADDADDADADGDDADDTGRSVGPLRQLESRSEPVQQAVWDLTAVVRRAVDLQLELAGLRASRGRSTG
ncbi:MAG TPA: hypothetical protein VD859_09180 [Nocardioides sp.]|nr:hypothetical protein [Nocardioides sp.]